MSRVILCQITPDGLLELEAAIATTACTIRRALQERKKGEYLHLQVFCTKEPNLASISQPCLLRDGKKPIRFVDWFDPFNRQSHVNGQSHVVTINGMRGFDVMSLIATKLMNALLACDPFPPEIKCESSAFGNSIAIEWRWL